MYPSQINRSEQQKTSQYNVLGDLPANQDFYENDNSSNETLRTLLLLFAAFIFFLGLFFIGRWLISISNQDTVSTASQLPLVTQICNGNIIQFNVQPTEGVGSINGGYVVFIVPGNLSGEVSYHFSGHDFEESINVPSSATFAGMFGDGPSPLVLQAGTFYNVTVGYNYGDPAVTYTETVTITATSCPFSSSSQAISSSSSTFIPSSSSSSVIMSSSSIAPVISSSSSSVLVISSSQSSSAVSVAAAVSSSQSSSVTPVVSSSSVSSLPNTGIIDENPIFLLAGLTFIIFGLIIYLYETNSALIFEVDNKNQNQAFAEKIIKKEEND